MYSDRTLRWREVIASATTTTASATTTTASATTTTASVDNWPLTQMDNIKTSVHLCYAIIFASDVCLPLYPFVTS